MTAEFPDAIVSYRAKANKSGVVYDAGKPTVGFAEDFEKLEEEVVAIETVLGDKSKWNFDTIWQWLQSLATTVIAHKTSHQNGGTDEISVAGLSGELADNQPPKAHQASHEHNGGDPLGNNFLNLQVDGQFIDVDYKETPTTADPFLLEDANDANIKKYTYWDDIRKTLKTYFDTLYTAVATFNDHSARHENGGGDEISVAGLSGALADAQTPTGHEASHTAGGSDELDGAKLEIEKAIAFFIDGGGSAITTGIKGAIRIPFKCEILSVSLLGDQSGSIVVNIWKDTLANYPPTVGDKITDTTPPTITTDTDSEDTTLTDWTKAIASGDVLMFNVDSVTDIEWASLIIKVKLVE